MTESQPAVLEAEAAAREFLEGSKHNYYRPLYHAANKGDWKTAKCFIDRDPSALTARITLDSCTILMVAATARKWKFMEKLIEILPPESLAMQDLDGLTALHLVAIGGSLKTARALTRRNPTLPQIPDARGQCPLFSSLYGKCKELVWYLVLVTKDEHPCLPFTGPLSTSLITRLIFSGFYDITLHLVRRYPQLVVFRNEFQLDMLTCLSLRYPDFLSGSKLKFWERWIYKLVSLKIRHVPPESILVNIEDDLGNAEYIANIAASIQQRSFLTRVLQRLKRLLWKAIEQSAPPLQHVREAKLNHVYLNELVNCLFAQISDRMNLGQIIEFLRGQRPVLAIATEAGVVEIVRALLQYFPFFIYDTGGGCNILQRTIHVRQAKIFNLITTEMPTIAHKLAFSIQVSEDNNTLHRAANLPRPGVPSTNQFLSVSGAAFQMQRELQWFKEVEKVLPYTFSTSPNKDGLAPKELFTKEHKELADKAEKWMKDTANSGMIVTTLITTVVLAAAFTVPGGNNDKGIPNFLDRTSFLVFVVADALALFSSATSLLMFLSILTARYAEEDFLRALPKRLIIGLGSLFFAIAAMMVAFGATLTIILSEKWQWAYIPIILLASVPVTVFVMLQLPLFIGMINSTYRSGIFGS